MHTAERLNKLGKFSYRWGERYCNCGRRSFALSRMEVAYCFDMLHHSAQLWWNSFSLFPLDEDHITAVALGPLSAQIQSGEFQSDIGATKLESLSDACIRVVRHDKDSSHIEEESLSKGETVDEAFIHPMVTLKEGIIVERKRVDGLISRTLDETWTTILNSI